MAGRSVKQAAVDGHPDRRADGVMRHVDIVAVHGAAVDDQRLLGDPSGIAEPPCGAAVVPFDRAVRHRQIGRRADAVRFAQGRKLLLEARLLRKWGGIFKEVGLDAQASAKADEGLQRVEEVFDLSRRQAVPRDVVENAYAAKWELLLVKGELDRAIGVCRELLRAYPDTVLADAALMGIAAIRAESDEIPKLASDCALLSASSCEKCTM